ncbi:MAG TPA: TonB family protein [Mucilaginibacter sp.]|jgi:protein TonB|nr:TonB family protein [Mucilaginibacter sp.]
MKPILSLIVALFAGSLYAQTVQKINLRRSERDIYYVLKADTNVKEGSFVVTSTYDTSRIIYSGFYKNNLKDSLWKYYCFNKLAEMGPYKNDKREGVWTMYNGDGSIQLKYDYSNKKLLFYQPSEYDNDIFKIFKGDSVSMGTLQQPPLYLHGSLTLINAIAWKIRYPAMAKEGHIKGNLIVSFKVNSDGHISDYKIVKHLQKDCDNEALRVIKLASEDWLPGMLDGKPVSVEYVIPVKFTLSD